jgi:hypothetical protein
MTDAITITPGQKFGAWTVVASDGRRTTCACRCGNIRVVTTEALISGESTSCGCMPPTADQQLKLKAEAQRQRQRALRDWRPGDRT